MPFPSAIHPERPPQPRPVRRAVVLAAALLLAGACAGLGQRLDPPKVTVVSVRLDRVQDAQAFFGITLELANPNPSVLTVDALDAAVAIEGEVVATAQLAAPVRVPASGSAEATLVAQTGVDALVHAAIAAMRRGAVTSPGHAPTLRYAIEGSARFNGGLAVPFEKRGEFGTQGSAAP